MRDLQMVDRVGAGPDLDPACAASGGPRCGNVVVFGGGGTGMSCFDTSFLEACDVDAISTELVVKDGLFAGEGSCFTIGRWVK